MPRSRQTGRPTKLTQPAATNGEQLITHGEQLITQLRLGLDLTAAAAATGIAAYTIHNWLRAGARARALQTQGHPTSPKEQAYVEFLGAFEKARVEAELARLAIIQRVAAGGHVVTKTTVTYDPAGNEVSRIVVSETMRPEWTAAAWWLERSMPEKYRRRTEVVVDRDDDGLSYEERLDGIVEAMRQHLASLPAGEPPHAE